MNDAAYHAILRRLGVEPVGQPASADSALLIRLLAMSLDVFAREGQSLEIRVRWWSETLWFVPDVRHAEALHREEIARHRIWTAGELIELLRVPGLTTEALLTIMRAREAFGGEVVEVRCR